MVSGVSLAVTAASAEVTLRYAHVGAEGEGQTRYAEELAKRVQEATDGRVKIEVFGNSQLGNLSEMLDAVRIGAIQMAHHNFSSLDRFYEDVAVFNAPYAYRDAEHAMRATGPDSPVLQEINEKLIENAGIRIIGNLYRGARHLTARYPVHRLPTWPARSSAAFRSSSGAPCSRAWGRSRPRSRSPRSCRR